MSFPWLYMDQHICPTVFSEATSIISAFIFIGYPCLEGPGSFAKAIVRLKSMLRTALYQLGYNDTTITPLANHCFVVEH